MRTVISAGPEGTILVQREALSKHPSGNGAQRKKQLKHGWQPTWGPCGQPTDLETFIGGQESENFNFQPLGFLEEPTEIAAAREIVERIILSRRIRPFGAGLWMS